MTAAWRHMGATKCFSSCPREGKTAPEKAHSEACAQARWDTAFSVSQYALIPPTPTSRLHSPSSTPFDIGICCHKPKRPFCIAQSVRGQATACSRSDKYFALTGYCLLSKQRDANNGNEKCKGRTLVSEEEVFFVLEISFSDSPVMQVHVKCPTLVLTLGSWLGVHMQRA